MPIRSSVQSPLRKFSKIATTPSGQHASTLGANAATVKATLEVINSEHLMKNAICIGEAVIKMKENYGVIGDIRGRNTFEGSIAKVDKALL
jgi:4-aminobutyrate aminotransferase-like enzyme